MESVQVEGALLRVPVEELKRLTRAQAKLAERELVALRELTAGNSGEGDADAWVPSPGRCHSLAGRRSEYCSTIRCSLHPR